MMLVGISGKKGVGKNAGGSYLEVAHGFRQVAFATYLKKMARKLGWTGRKDETGRKFLQNLGTAVRANDPAFFINKVVQEIRKIRNATGSERFVVTDVRYINEIEWIKSQGGIVIRLWRTTEDKEDQHSSEVELDGYEGFDDRIEVIKGDYNSLYRDLDEVLKVAFAESTSAK